MGVRNKSIEADDILENVQWFLKRVFKKKERIFMVGMMKDPMEFSERFMP